MQTPFLIGERIYLRPMEKQDAPLIQQIINDPEVQQTLQVHRPITLQSVETNMEASAKDDSTVSLRIALKADDRLIGTLSLRLEDAKDRKASLGIAIAKEEWSKGYGTEATRLIVQHGFETLSLNRIWLRVYEFNPRGVRAYEKVGFKREGVLRQDVFSQGRFWDVFTMAILSEEWFASKAQH